MRYRLICLFLALSTLIFFSVASKAATSESQKLADQVMIIDVHHHLNWWVSPADVLDQMKRNNIGWLGAVGPTSGNASKTGPLDMKPYVDALGDRFIPAIGQTAFSRIFRDGGATALVDPTNEVYQRLFATADDLFASGRARGFGEIHINNSNTNPEPAFRRKISFTATPIVTMATIAQRHGGFLQFHAEDDSDTVEQLKDLAGRFPDVTMILSHCLESTDTALIRGLLKQYPNLFCDLSARSSLFFFAGAPAAKVARYTLYDDANFRSDWIELVDSMPTRFMLGSDTFRQDIDFDKVIAQLRRGLLANLQPASIELVANGNAKRIFKLTQ